jgi:hypothetical protein
MATQRAVGVPGLYRWRWPGRGRVGGVRTWPKQRDHRWHQQSLAVSPKSWQTLVCPEGHNGFG